MTRMLEECGATHAQAYATFGARSMHVRVRFRPDGPCVWRVTAAAHTADVDCHSSALPSSATSEWAGEQTVRGRDDMAAGDFRRRPARRRAQETVDSRE